MSALKLHTLKQKLWAIVAASFVARVIVFFALPNTPSFLAPDEATYSSFAKWVADEKPLEEFPFFGSRLYYSGRSIVLPASNLIKFGINELDAIRFTSTLYGFLALCAAVYLASKLLKPNNSGVTRNKKIERLVVTLLAVYAFLPSHFVWSNLGLREGPNEFWLIMVFIGVFLLYKEEQSNKPLLAVFISISIICTFSSRPQVGWLVAVTLLVYSLFRMKNKLTYLLITSVLTGMFAGYLATTSFAYVTSDLYVAKESTPTPTKESTPTPTNSREVNASKLCDGTRLKVEYQGITYNCVKSGTTTKRERTSNLAEVAIDQVEALPGKQVANQVGAASMIERLACPWDESSEIGKYGCLTFRAPYMALTFLFRPLPFIDTTSMSSTFAAAENMLWIFMFALIVYRISKDKGIPFIRELGPSLVFFSLYVVGAGSYEGNMGTAFRHKSLILWVPLLLLSVLFWQKDSRVKDLRGNNSQESAV
jgi:hypothetical protein